MLPVELKIKEVKFIGVPSPRHLLIASKDIETFAIIATFVGDIWPGLSIFSSLPEKHIHDMY